MKIARLTIILSALSFSACAFEHKKGADKNAAALSSGDHAVTYAEVYTAVLGPRCVGCHGAGGGNQGNLNLETYENTFPVAAKIEKTALVDKTMPKGSALSDDESRLLATWLSQGATRNGALKGNSKLKANLTWQVIHDEILAPKCVDCHSQPRPEKELDLNDYGQVKVKIAKIFERAVVTQDMPLAPVEHLTVEEKQALAQWIALGMPE